MDTLEKGDAILDGEREGLLSKNEEDIVWSRDRDRDRRNWWTGKLALVASFVLGILLTALVQHLYPRCILFSMSSITSTSSSSDDSDWVILANPAAGSTTHHTFPPAHPTNVFPSLFPTDVGFPGPTPTGGEPALVVTAPSYPVRTGLPDGLLGPAKLASNKHAGKGKGKKKNKNFNLFRLFGNLSPWYSVPSKRFGGEGMKNANGNAPDGCVITGLHLLHRHGARYPTNYSSYGGPSVFASGIREANRRKEWIASGPLEFLNDWTYKLGEEVLTPFGRQQLYDLGVSMRMKYGFLLQNFTEGGNEKVPVFRTESQPISDTSFHQDRMLKSAKNFALGFFGWPTDGQYQEVVMIEAKGFNNTLAPYTTCPNTSNHTRSDLGTPALRAWSEVYLKDAVKRLNGYMKGYGFGVEEVYAMMQMCAYETVAIGYSKFCELFTEEEWEGFAYATDLYFYYGSAFGNPLSRVQGVGYIIELLARLTKTPIERHWTTTNSTLTDDRRIFPFDQSLYVDATHEVVILNVITALGLSNFAGDGPLPTTHIPKNRAFRTDELAPFASNVQFQLLYCSSQSSDETETESEMSSVSHKHKPSGPQIRILINDGVTPLEIFPGCPRNKDGLCPLEKFVEEQRRRVEETDWEWGCYGEWDPSWQDVPGGGDGSPPPRPKME